MLTCEKFKSNLLTWILKQFLSKAIGVSATEPQFLTSAQERGGCTLGEGPQNESESYKGLG